MKTLVKINWEITLWSALLVMAIIIGFYCIMSSRNLTDVDRTSKLSVSMAAQLIAAEMKSNGFKLDSEKWLAIISITDYEYINSPIKARDVFDTYLKYTKTRTFSELIELAAIVGIRIENGYLNFDNLDKEQFKVLTQPFIDEFDLLEFGYGYTTKDNPIFVNGSSLCFDPNKLSTGSIITFVDGNVNKMVE